jgi:hypothetical protein
LVLSRYFPAETEENHENISQGTVSGKRFETRTSRIGGRSVNHSITTFSDMCALVATWCNLQAAPESFVCSLFKDAFKLLTQTMQRRMKGVTSKLWTGKDVEGSGRGLLLRQCPSICWRDREKSQKTRVVVARVRENPSVKTVDSKSCVRMQKFETWPFPVKMLTSFLLRERS